MLRRSPSIICGKAPNRRHRNVTNTATYSCLCAVEHKQDGATGEFGDLLDVIRESRGFSGFKEALDEARFFLKMPRPEPNQMTDRINPTRLHRIHKPIRQAFVRHVAGNRRHARRDLSARDRAITALHDTASLRFHPRCYYKPDDDSETELWPAMIAAVTDLDHRLTGVLRTWLDPRGFSDATLGKAPIKSPRRAMGDLAGKAVRFGVAGEVMAVGEGIETVLSLRCVLPTMPMAAALSAGNLAAFDLPGTLRRLYVVRDNDPAGERAAMTLIDRAGQAGVEAFVIAPTCADFNEDLQLLGLEESSQDLARPARPERCSAFLRVRGVMPGT